MFVFDVDLPFLFAVAAGHGFVDFGRPTEELFPYLFVFLPLGSLISTVTFFFASLLHFSSDITLLGSLVLHTLFLVLDYFHRPWAVAAGIFYLSLFHVPLLMHSFVKRRMWGELLVLFISVVAAAAFKDVLLNENVFIFSEWKQRIVSAHVFVHERAHGCLSDCPRSKKKM